MNQKTSTLNFPLILQLQRLGLAFVGPILLIVLLAQCQIRANAAEPIFAQQTKIVKGGIPQINERFGIGVVNGNWAAIGVPESDFISAQDQGIVYLYQRNGSSWTLAQLLIAGDGAAFDRFGASIALNGTTLVIGAPEANGSNNRNNMGAVYVYKLSGGTWTLQQKLTASDGQASDRFGVAIGFNGLNIVVGAPGEYFTDAHTSGAAYVFGLSGSTWVQQQKLTASDVALGGGFGSAISMSGANLAVSSRHNPFLSIPKGAVYSFQQSGGWWNYQQKLTSPSPLGATHSVFGHRLSMSGTTLAIGGEIIKTGTGEAVYVYTLSGATWSLQQGIIPPDDDSLIFGSAIALEGNRLVVGNSYDKVLASAQRGSAYVYERTGSIWNLRQKLIAPDGVAGDDFGSFASLSGNTIFIAAPLSDTTNAQDSGSVNVFTLQAGNTLPTITAYGPYTIQSGSTVHNLPIAALTDAETPVASLLFDYDDTTALTFSNVVNAGGYVSASITCACGFATGVKKAELNVVDAGKAVGVATISVNKTANTAPTIGTYPATSVVLGGSKTVFPNSAPNDNGTYTIAASASAGFIGTLLVNQSNGSITIISSLASAKGTFTVTVTVKDNCNAVTTRTFPLTVL